jgi:hypothetical protein
MDATATIPLMHVERKLSNETPTVAIFSGFFFIPCKHRYSAYEIDPESQLCCFRQPVLWILQLDQRVWLLSGTAVNYLLLSCHPTWAWAIQISATFNL